MAWRFYSNVGVTPFGLKCPSCGPLKAPLLQGANVMFSLKRAFRDWSDGSSGQIPVTGSVACILVLGLFQLDASRAPG